MAVTVTATVTVTVMVTDLDPSSNIHSIRFDLIQLIIINNSHKCISSSSSN